MVTGVLALVVKRPWCDADKSPPCSADVRNEWSFISATPICLPDMDRGSFTFKQCIGNIDLKLII